MRDALAGDQERLAALVDDLTPIVQVRVARSVLRRPGRLAGAALRQEVEDLVQEVLLSLFEDDAKVLRRWDPERGMSLQNYVGLVAERRVASILRSGKKTGREEPTAPEELDREAPHRSAELRVASRDRLAKICSRLRECVSPLGWRMFRLLFVEELSPREITRATGLSADAIYAWRSRLRGRARSLAREIEEDSSTEIGASERIPEAEGRITDEETSRSPPPRITGGTT